MAKAFEQVGRFVKYRECEIRKILEIGCSPPSGSIQKWQEVRDTFAEKAVAPHSSTVLMLGSSKFEWHFSLCSTPIDQLLSGDWYYLILKQN